MSDEPYEDRDERNHTTPSWGDAAVADEEDATDGSPATAMADAYESASAPLALPEQALPPWSELDFPATANADGGPVQPEDLWKRESAARRDYVVTVRDENERDGGRDEADDADQPAG